jgi:hypothetical protein
MQKCPKCGYNEGPDWPGLFLLLAFAVVALGAEILDVPIPKSLRVSGWFFVVVSFAWRAVRVSGNRIERSELHPAATEPPKKI